LHIDTGKPGDAQTDHRKKIGSRPSTHYDAEANIERKLQSDFERPLVAWATSPPEAREQSRQQLDKAQKRLTDLLVELKFT
jgi:hypothetical protein